MTLKDVIDSAHALGFSTRPIRCEPDELKQLRLPSILHWDMNHFVVLGSVAQKKIVVHDPAKGRREIGFDEVAKRFTGIGLELIPTPEFKAQDAKPTARLRDFWSRIRGLASGIVYLFILSLLLQVFALLGPLVNQLIVDEAIARQDVTLLGSIVLGFALLALVQSGINLLRAYVAMYMETHMTFQMRTNLLGQLLRLPHSFFEKRHVGDIVMRFGSLAPIQQLLTTGLMRAVLDTLLVSGTLIIMLIYSPMLAGVVILGVVVQFVAQILSFPYVRRLTELGIQASAETETYFLETIRASRSVRLFGKESLRISSWQNLFADQLNVSVRMTRFGAWARSLQTLFSSLERLLVLYLAARLIISGQMSIGMLFAFMSYRGSFVSAAAGIVGTFFQWRLAGLHLERISDIVQSKAEPNAGSSQAHPKLAGNVRIHNLQFRYGDNEPWLLDGFSLDVEAGERVVIVGPSGSGKSTLIKLLAGLYEPHEGSILYDGRSISQWGIKHVRSNLGVIMQDDRLLSGSLADNISFFDPQSDHERVIECAEIAQINEEISRMPMGYATLVGDMGSALSSGQIQRIMLARALYSDPAILLLDEGTANLDHQNEDRIIRSLSSISVTQIIVAHRSKVIESADRVVTLGQATLNV